MKIVLLLALVAGAVASCQNGCSGHGHCGLYDMCKCYGNWEGNDCSGRVCPYEKAWVDTPIATNDAHNYARCANKGECDGKAGQCKCWEPFEGKGCRRMACPNQCSGHGTCETIAELGAGNKCDWDPLAYAAKTDCVHASLGHTLTNPISYGTKTTADMPSVWDSTKIQGCKCDPGYSGSDCSGRTCPSGDDPLRHLTGTTSQSAQSNHKFTLTIDASGATASTYFEAQASSASLTAGMGPSTFVLAFEDTFGEKWFTRPIPLYVDGTCDDEGTCPLKWRKKFVTDFTTMFGECPSPELHQGCAVDGDCTGSCGSIATVNNAALILGHNIRAALLDLPNGAVTGEAVNPRTGEKDSSALKVACASSAAKVVACTIEMNSSHNSGSLSNKLSCENAGCMHEGVSSAANPGGCSPKYQGLGATPATCLVTDTNVGTSDYDTCSGRGACNGADGVCECFDGFTDEDCSVQTVLV